MIKDALMTLLATGIFMAMGSSALADTSDSFTCTSVNAAPASLSPELSNAVTYFTKYYATWNAASQDISKLPSVIGLYDSKATVGQQDSVGDIQVPTMPASAFATVFLNSQPKSVHSVHTICISGNKVRVGLTYSAPAKKAGQKGVRVDLVASYIMQDTFVKASSNVVSALSINYDISWFMEQAAQAGIPVGG